MFPTCVVVFFFIRIQINTTLSSKLMISSSRNKLAFYYQEALCEQKEFF
jgi:hypothetical protein